MYHPAAALHQGSLNETLFRDMQGVPGALLEARKQRSSAPEPVAARVDPAAGAEPSPTSDAPIQAVGELDPEGAESDPTDQLPLF
jgi:hypothetical protein